MWQTPTINQNLSTTTKHQTVQIQKMRNLSSAKTSLKKWRRKFWWEEKIIDCYQNWFSQLKIKIYIHLNIKSITMISNNFFQKLVAAVVFSPTYLSPIHQSQNYSLMSLDIMRSNGFTLTSFSITTLLFSETSFCR